MSRVKKYLKCQFYAPLSKLFALNKSWYPLISAQSQIFHVLNICQSEIKETLKGLHQILHFDTAPCKIGQSMKTVHRAPDGGRTRTPFQGKGF